MKLRRDPINPPEESLVRTESCVKFHSALRKIVTLLAIDSTKGPIYFVVEGLAEWPCEYDELQRIKAYYYETHTCPTNFIDVKMIAHGGDPDPHGVFRFVRSIWMTDEYNCRTGHELDEYLATVFPEMGLETEEKEG